MAAGAGGGGGPELNDNPASDAMFEEEEESVDTDAKAAVGAAGSLGAAGVVVESGGGAGSEMVEGEEVFPRVTAADVVVVDTVVDADPTAGLLLPWSCNVVPIIPEPNTLEDPPSLED